MKMGDKVPFIPIKEFEAENILKLMDLEEEADEDHYDLNAQAKPHSNHTNTGDCYSESVDLILDGMGLSKYKENFKTHDIGLNVLFYMSAKDLETVGMTDLDDVERFKSHLVDFDGISNKIMFDIYKVEEDLIMARNLFAHLEEINAHLNFIKLNVNQVQFSDYFVNSNHSISKIFEKVIKCTLAQARKMSNVLFSGTFTRDCLIGDCLNTDNLELPDFMKTKLLHPNKEFGIYAKHEPKKKFYGFITSASALAFGICFSAIIFRKFVRN